MDMDTHDAALALAGIIGSGTAVVHGVLVQRLMVRPIRALAATDRRLAGPVGRLIPMLMHFSTAAWLAGGLALVAAAIWCDGGARTATGVLVGAAFLFGAVGNLWGTRGRHPGWMLMVVAVALIAYGLS
jgi:hypothetical protein